MTAAPLLTEDKQRSGDESRSDSRYWDDSEARTFFRSFKLQKSQLYRRDYCTCSVGKCDKRLEEA